MTHHRSNQYRGINAHLHSYFQQQSAWSMFHGMHITHLTEALQALLPPESGYLAVAEQSLQILRDDTQRDEQTRTRIVQDIGVYKGATGEAPIPTQAATPGAVVPLIETFDVPEHVTATVIYKADDSSLGQPITRLELLSPANKPPGSHYRQYLAKRDATLASGITMIELDYLHERRSPLAILPNYRQRDANAYPYVITVSHPHPAPDAGHTYIYGFRVDEPIPVVSVPLAGDDHIAVDFDAVYQRTFHSNFAFGLRLVDYAQEPAGFATYDADDQRRIRAVMQRSAP